MVKDNRPIIHEVKWIYRTALTVKAKLSSNEGGIMFWSELEKQWYIFIRFDECLNIIK